MASKPLSNIFRKVRRPWKASQHRGFDLVGPPSALTAARLLVNTIRSIVRQV